ncbi:DUF2922 family protein [Enterococcus hulanensis]|uniref:DUF2922 family protein n=1 Tax=Enterococcus hulanensis TaxID=2559929 RepID=UPI001A9094DE|nr:DUF2922 family protein [Enterococcus hulanensis]MBO0455545.1 DUF2922 family protein [Enterococcus hulanensis]
MITTLTLDAEFADSNGKSRHLRFKNFDSTKTAEQIKTALTKLTKLDLFEKDGVGLYKEVLHATVIEKTVEEVFDERTQAQDPSIMMMEPAMELTEAEPLSVEEEPLKSVQAMANIENSQIPQDLTITEVSPEPGLLIQTVELPKGFDPWSLDENQAISLLAACVPPNATPLNVEIDDQSVPARMIITERLEEGAVKAEVPAMTQSPPEKPKKKRKRLLDRIRKRE